MLKTVIVKI